MAEDFNTWLSNKLQSLELDEEVYLDYIKSILEESAEYEETKESLTEILSGVLEDGFEDHAEDILKNYKEFSEKKPINKETTSTLIGDSKDTDDKIKNLIMKQQEQVSTDSDKNAKAGRLVDNEMKKLVLNQYNNRGANNGSDDSDGESAAMPSGFQNVNAESVVRKQQEQRDKAKKASDEKKVRDKLNRDVQKQKKDDRKEKEKQRTQKGERRK